MGLRFEIVGSTQEKSKSKDLLFSIQSEGLAWNHPQGAWNPSQCDGMASRASVHPPSDWFHTPLCDDSIQGFALIPYRRQAADSIHGLRRDFIELRWCSWFWRAFLVFRSKKPLSPLYFFSTFWNWTVTVSHHWRTGTFLIYYRQKGESEGWKWKA